MAFYDNKNQQDFDAVTERINAALQKIRTDDTLKCSVSTLADMAGVHRNTINNRQWPIEQLRGIKTQRKAAKEAAKNGEHPIDPEIKRAEQLEKAKIEIAYWYQQSTYYKELYEAVSSNLTDMVKSRDIYRSKATDLASELTKSKHEIGRLSELLNMVKE